MVSYGVTGIQCIADGFYFDKYDIAVDVGKIRYADNTFITGNF
jgi:hypothetical protein